MSSAESPVPLEFTPVLGILVGVVLTLMLVVLVVILVLRLKYKKKTAKDYANERNNANNGSPVGRGGGGRGSGKKKKFRHGDPADLALEAAKPNEKDHEDYYCLTRTSPPHPDEDTFMHQGTVEKNPDIIPNGEFPPSVNRSVHGFPVFVPVLFLAGRFSEH